jgi:hypothetical protein
VGQGKYQHIKIWCCYAIDAKLEIMIFGMSFLANFLSWLVDSKSDMMNLVVAGIMTVIFVTVFVNMMFGKLLFLLLSLKICLFFMQEAAID